MRIPRFQREYVWERSKIVKLLNSIIHSYPIGSFSLWETDTSMEALVRNIPELNLPTQAQSNRFVFILDGQQRITSLYVAMKGKKLNGVDYSSICYNLEKKVFVIPRLKSEQHNIPVWKIWDECECMQLVMDYTMQGENGREYAQTLLTCTSRYMLYLQCIIMFKILQQFIQKIEKSELKVTFATKLFVQI